MTETSIFRLHPAVQHYDWGGFHFIPALLGQPNAGRKPYAEMWLGAHPKAPAAVETPAGPVALNDWISRAPERWLGPACLARFGPSLPYLLKVLDARQMLSIQVHPTREQARQGFERENLAGIPIHAPHRNYKDRNHKPEVHAALTEFWMLHGFRPLEEIAEVLRQTPEFHGLMPAFDARLAAAAGQSARSRLMKDLYSHVMHLPQARVDEILDALILRLEAGPAPGKDTAAFWALRAARAFPLPGGRRDRGIFSIYFMNLVRLQPGQGAFQPAGALHAYLEGVTVELMADSDNVLRGGLTAKHVDVEELLRVVGFETGPCRLLEPDGGEEPVWPYRTPAGEFELARIRLLPGRRVPGRCQGPQILLVLEGAAVIESGRQRLELARGQSVFAAHGAGYELRGAPAAEIYRAQVGAPD